MKLILASVTGRQLELQKTRATINFDCWSKRSCYNLCWWL